MRKRRGSSATRLAGFVLVVLACALAGGAAARADNTPGGQYLYWDDTFDSTHEILGADQAIVTGIGKIDYIDTCYLRNYWLPSDKRGNNDFIYPSADVYIVPHGTLTDHAKLEDALGSPNTMQTDSGGTFIDEQLGYTTSKGADGAKGGSYDIVFDECQDGYYSADTDALFDNALTVDLSLDVPPFPADAKQKIKDDAGKIEEQVKKTKDYLAKEIDAAYTVAALEDPTVAFIKGLGTKSLFADPGAVTIILYENLGAHWKGIHDDPPDADFKHITTLPAVQSPATSSPDDLRNALVATAPYVATEAALAEALQHAMERYMGAQAAGDGEWALVHAREVQRFADALQAQVTAKDGALASLRAAVAADPAALDVQGARLQSYVDGVRDHGFTSAQTALFANYGLTPAQVDELKARILEDDSPGFSRAALLSAIDSVRSEDADLASSAAGLSDGMDGIVAYLHANDGVAELLPAAAAGGPYTGAAGAPVAFDGSGSAGSTVPGSSVTVTQYAWDLNGDGVFDDATGASPSFTYAHGYHGQVGLRVTNSAGYANVGYATLDVADPNHPPDFTASAPAADPALAVGETQPFTAAATDADGDALTMHWLVDGAEAATGPSYTYTASTIGVHSVVAQAVDAHGAATARAWHVSVLAPDADGDGWNANADCNDGDARVHPGQPEIVGDLVDNDCDASTPDGGSPPHASFSFGPAASGSPTTFTDTSTDPNDDIVSWSWTFGDLSVGSTARNPVHTFPAAATYAVSLTTTDATGRTDTISHDVVVADSPTADFTFVPGAPAVGGAVQFTDASHVNAGSIVSWSWSFGDGSGSTDQSPEHVFGSVGSFDVTLVVTDGNGLTGTITKTVTTAAADPASAPLAAFYPQGSRNLANGADGATVVDSSGWCCSGHEPQVMLDDVISWPWAVNAGPNQFATIKLTGDGTAKIDRIGVQPRADGYFEQRVKDFAVDVSNDGVTFTNVLAATTVNDGTLQIFTLPVPVAAKYVRYRPLSNWGCCYFSTSRFTVLTGEFGGPTVSFANISKNATSYQWTFGDGGASTAAAPSHTYADAGRYAVKLVARSDDGRSSTSTGSYTVMGLRPSFTFTPNEPPVGGATTFADTSSAFGVKETSWHWEFGDGQGANGPQAVHAFAAAGTYAVKLSVADDAGDLVTLTQFVTVGGPNAAPLAAFDPQQPGAQTDVARSTRGGVVDGTTQCCHASATTLNDGNVDNGQWWSVDRSAGQSLTVTLPRVMPIDGLRLAIQNGWWEMIHDFDVQVSTTTSDASAFTTVFHGATTWETKWEEFVFPRAALAKYVRIVPLSISANNPCCYSLSGLQVLSGADGGRDVVFHNQSQGADSYSWDFGDGTTSTDASPAHTFAAAGTYTVTLTATKSGGASSTFTTQQVVRQTGLTASPAQPTTSDLVQFADQSAGILGKSWLWQFDDGTTSVFRSPVKRFASAGDHQVSLTVTDEDGRAWSATKTITVSAGGPRAAFTPQGTFNAAADFSGASIVAQSSFYGGCWNPQTLIDRDPSNCGWATGDTTSGQPAWVRIALAPTGNAAPWVVDSITVTPRVDDQSQRPTQFEIAASDSSDPASFVVVGQGALADNGSPQTFALPTPVSARYVEYRTLGNRGSACCTTTSRLTVNSGQVTEPGSVTFANDSIAASTYSWDFGDGTQSTSAAPTVSHAYAQPGVYTVTLTACDASSACDTKTAFQRVLAPITPSMAFSGLSTNGTTDEGHTLTLTDTTATPSGSVAYVDWNFGDGTPASTGPSLAHSWGDNGTYTVTGKVTTTLQQTGTFTRQLTVANVAPHVDLGADRQFYESRYLTFSYAYGDPGANESLTCTYDWGDGTAGSTGGCGSFQHEYPAGAKTYTVGVTIRDKDGATSTDTMLYTTVKRAQAGYAATDFTGKFPGSVFPAPFNCCGPIGIAFDSSSTAFVSDYANGFIYTFGSAGGSPDDLHKLPAPVNCAIAGLAFSKSGRLYGARQGCSDVVEIDPVKGGVLRVVASGVPGATGLATDPISGDLFASTIGNTNGLARISHFEDGGPVQVTKYGSLGGIDGVTIGPDGTMWIEVDGWLGKVQGTNTANPGAMERVVQIPYFDGVAVSASTDPSKPSYVYANRNDGTITKIDLSGPTPLLTDIFVGGTRGDFVAVGPDGCLYATQSDRVVKVTFADGTCGLASTSVVPQLGLAPANASAITGQQHSVTATLTNVLAPAGTVVTFTVTGANATVGTAIADTNGIATFSYSGAHVGVDTVIATTTSGATNITSNPATVTWDAPPNRAPVAADQTLAVQGATPLTLGATDPDGDALTFSVLTQPAHGTLSGAGAALVYTPSSSTYAGPDSFTFQANDGTLDSNVATVSIAVTPTNRAPVAADDTYSLHAGGVLHVAAPGPLANDTDPDGDTTAVAAGTQPAHGSYLLTAGGDLTYTPASGFTGTDSFTYRISDGALTSAPATITVDVRDAAPVGQPESYNVHVGQTLHVDAPGVLGNDADTDGDPLTASSEPQHPAHGLAILANTGALDYTPEAGFVGDDTFTYTPNDGFTDGAPVTVTIHVTDSAPVGGDDLYTTVQDQTLTIDDPGVLANDIDPDGDPVTKAVLVTQAAHGQALLKFVGGFVYTPAPGFHGMDSFTYAASDGVLQSAPVTVRIMVDGAPTANPDSLSVHGGQSVAAPFSSLTANDTDPEGEPLFVDAASVGGAAHGSLVTSGTGLVYTPDHGFSGDDTFTYRVTDGRALSAPAIVTVHVLDAAPVAVPDSYSVHAGQVLNVAAPGPLANDSDPDGDAFAVVAGTQPAHGTYVLSAAGDLTYTPAAGFVGTDSFTYRVGDGALSSAPATITVEVTNAVPVAQPETYSVHFGQTLHVDAPGVLANDTDPDGDPVTASSEPQRPAHGLALLASTGALDYIPAAGYVGDDTFTYTPNDGFADGTPVTVTVHVTDAAPVAGPDSAAILQGSSASGNVLTNDSDPDGDTLRVAQYGAPAHGAAQVGADGAFTYTPDPAFSGVDSFTYLLSDGGLSVPGMVTITVKALNRPPVIDLVTAPQTIDEASPASQLLVTAHDPDGDALSYTWTTDAGTLAPAGATASFMADDGPATAHVSVVVSDGKGGSVQADTQVTVRNVAPTAQGAAAPARQYWGLPVHFAGSATDPSHADTTAGLVPQWSFGDAALALGAAVDHAYATPGTYEARFTAIDKDGGRGDSAAVAVAIDKRGTRLVYTGTTNAVGTAPATLSARLVDTVDTSTASLAGHLVTFAVGGQTFGATTDAAGVATVASHPAFGSGAITATFAGDALYTASSAAATLVVWDGSGFFAVGPSFASLGATAPFWGSQWAKTNLLDAPSSFKGWVSTTPPPVCGGAWSASPGNSGGPPASLPSVIPVVVTSHVTKSGSAIGGTTSHVVLVKVGPGYGPAPGHDGIGQVVLTVC